jgi:hypothetical protein
MSVTSELIELLARASRGSWPGGPQPPSPPGRLAWPGTGTPAPPAPPPTPPVPGPAPGMLASPPMPPIGIPPRPGQLPAIPESMARAQNTPSMPPLEQSLRERLAQIGTGAAGVGAVGAAVPMLGGDGLGQIRRPEVAGGEVVPPAAPPSAPAPQTAPANAAAPTAQDRYRAALERIALGGGGGGGGGFRPDLITSDMLPNWQLVREANAAARPEAAEQISDETMRRNVLMAFLGSFESRPGERLGSAFARQGGAAGRARTGGEEQNRQTRDVTRREQQAYRQGQAALEAQIQTGQSQSLIGMMTANNAARAQAAQLAQAGGGRSLQALLALSQMDDPNRQVAPEYVASRIGQAASDPRNPLVIPGLNTEAARERALTGLSPAERTMVTAGQPNQRFQQRYAEEIMREIMGNMSPEQQARLLQAYRSLATTRPSATARVGEQ